MCIFICTFFSCHFRSDIDNWVVPENIRTPTTGGIEILPPPPHAFGNSKMLHPPRIRNSRLLYPPSLSEFQRCFRPLQNFLFNLLAPPPQKSFFRPLKKMRCILNLTLENKSIDQFKQHAVPIVQLSLLWFL